MGFLGCNEFVGKVVDYLCVIGLSVNADLLQKLAALEDAEKALRKLYPDEEQLAIILNSMYSPCAAEIEIIVSRLLLED